MMEYGTEKYPYKIILCGRKGVGKSSLLEFLRDNVDEGYEQQIVRSSTYANISTRHNRTKSKFSTNCDGKDIEVEIWDTGDMEAHSGSVGMTKTYYRNSHGAILIYERSDEMSKTDLTGWAKHIQDANGPHCIISVWCNNKLEEFGSGLETRDTISTLLEMYKINPRLHFTYTRSDKRSIHTNFNQFIGEIHTYNQYNPLPVSESIRLDDPHVPKWKQILKCQCKN